MNPDDLQLEIPLQEESFLQRQPDGSLKPSLRLLITFVNEQTMMGYPALGHISSEQYDAFKDDPAVTVVEVEDGAPYLEVAVAKNDHFAMKVIGRADHPGTDYYEEPVNEGETYVPPVFDPTTGIPQDLPSVIKPAENKEEQTDEVSEDERPA